MPSQLDLMNAVRSGSLQNVRSLLDSGITLDGEGEPGLIMGLACFFGHATIVRELVSRGAHVNLQDNKLPTSPLNMAIRGKRKEVVRLLIEFGAEVPEGMQTGLTPQEVTVAQWIAFRDGYVKAEDGSTQPAEEVEEIQFNRPNHVDTQILEAEALREVLAKR